MARKASAEYGTYIATSARRGATRTVSAAAGKPEPVHKIEVRFLGGLNTAQKNAFKAAADRWASVIIGDLPSVRVDGEIVDDLLILAQGAEIDGPGGVLGQAGPTHIRPASAGKSKFLQVKGIMTFDTADLKAMQKDGTLTDMITHVPVENVGGIGTADVLWREGVFRNELMSGFIASRNNPLSRLTVASLADMGYEVDMTKAEPYTLPNLLALAAAGATTTHGEPHALPVIPTVLPDSSLID